MKHWLTGVTAMVQIHRRFKDEERPDAAIHRGVDYWMSAFVDMIGTTAADEVASRKKWRQLNSQHRDRINDAYFRTASWVCECGFANLMSRCVDFTFVEQHSRSLLPPDLGEPFNDHFKAVVDAYSEFGAEHAPFVEKHNKRVERPVQTP